MIIDYDNGYIDENGNFVYIQGYRQKYKRIEELKQNLKETDYKAIKYSEGQISEEEYVSVKEQRQNWRDEINEREEEIKQN